MNVQLATETDFSLSEREVADFVANGYLGPFDLLSPEEAKARWKQERLKLFDRTHVVYPDAESSSGLYNYDRHLDSEFLAEVVSRPEIVHRISSILGPDVQCWRTEFFPKYAGDEGTAWHQADHFGGASGTAHIEWPNGSSYKGALTAWIAFTDAREDMGCMQIIPGTQKVMHFDENKGMRFRPGQINQTETNGIRRGFYGYDWQELKVDETWEPDEARAVTLPCNAGQFLLFWSTVVHASLPHLGQTDEPRIPFFVRYIPTSVRVYAAYGQTGRLEEYGGSVALDRYGVVQVAGRDDAGHNRVLTHTLRGVPFQNRRPR